MADLSSVFPLKAVVPAEHTQPPEISLTFCLSLLLHGIITRSQTWTSLLDPDTESVELHRLMH